MRFIIIYRNHPKLRAAVETVVAQIVAQGHDFSQNRLRTNFFQTELVWPRLDQLASIPLWAQLEEVEFKDGVLVSLRQLVIDAEVIETVEELAEVSA